MVTIADIRHAKYEAAREGRSLESMYVSPAELTALKAEVKRLTGVRLTGDWLTICGVTVRTLELLEPRPASEHSGDAMNYLSAGRGWNRSKKHAVCGGANEPAQVREA